MLSASSVAAEARDAKQAAAVAPHWSLPVPLATALAVSVAALGSCNDGFDIGVNTGVGPLLSKDLGLSTWQLGFFMGSINLFGAVGCLAVAPVSDRFGRRSALFLSALACCLGMSIMAAATGYGTLMVGRAFVGTGVGFGMPVTPMYIAEISPKEYRGALVSASEIAINVGILLGFVTSYAFQGYSPNVGWRLMLLVGAVLPAFVLLGVCVIMPESPRWLIQMGLNKEALEVLQSMSRPGEDVHALAHKIRASADEDAKRSKVSWSKVLCPTTSLRQLLVAALGISIAQQLSGINPIQYFLISIMESAGIAEQAERFKYLVALGFFKLVCIFIAGKFFDTCGRRPLMMVSVAGMAGSLCALATLMSGADQKEHRGSLEAQLAVVTLAVYLGFFSAGLGPGNWVMPSELLPNMVRAKGLSLVNLINRILSFGLTTATLPMSTLLGWQGLCSTFAALNLLSLVCFFFYLPETKGQGLEEIGGPCRSSSTTVSSTDSANEISEAEAASRPRLVFQVLVGRPTEENDRLAQ